MKVMLAGSERIVHCRRYIHLLTLAGCEVIFAEQEMISHRRVPNVRYRRYPHRYQPLEKFVGTRLTHYLHEQLLRTLWQRVKPDICHLQWIDDRVWRAARAGVRPLVATAWGSDLNLIVEVSADDPVRQRIAAGLRALDLLIVDSEDMVTTAELIADKNLNTALLPIGIDTAQFRPELRQQRRQWREKLRIASEATVLISPRQLGANYRQLEIIRAFAALAPDFRRDCYLILRTFGHGNGVSLTELHKLADKLGIAARIRWVGDLEYVELPGLYAASDLAINFPIMDAFPVTFLECFSCGLPVITNRQISYESNGAPPYLCYIDRDSVAGLKAAIEFGINSLQELQIISMKAREHVVQNYDEKLTARALSKAYADVFR